MVQILTYLVCNNSITHYTKIRYHFATRNILLKIKHDEMITGTTFPLTLTGPFVAKRISIESSINRSDSNRRSRSLPYLTGLITIIIALPTELVVTAALAHGLALNRITRRSQLTGELIAASSTTHSYSLAHQSGL